MFESRCDSEEMMTSRRQLISATDETYSSDIVLYSDYLINVACDGPDRTGPDRTGLDQLRVVTTWSTLLVVDRTGLDWTGPAPSGDYLVDVACGGPDWTGLDLTSSEW